LRLKDAEIAALQQLIASADERHRHVVEARIRDAVSQREEELRASVVRHQQEVSAAMVKREEELMDAVKQREEELRVAWIQREQEIRDEMSNAVEERMEWVRKQAEEVEEERRRLDATRAEVENKVKTISDGTVAEKTGMGFHLSSMKSYLSSTLLKVEGKRRHTSKRSRMFLPHCHGWRRYHRRIHPRNHRSAWLQDPWPTSRPHLRGRSARRHSIMAFHWALP
jgi:hypothetical protein